MKNYTFIALFLGCFFTVFAGNNGYAQSTRYSFYFQESAKSSPQESILISPDCRYSVDQPYGYDLIRSPKEPGTPFCFSVKIPDGDYLITVVLGSRTEAGQTSVRAESRRSFIENVQTFPGQFKKEQFLVHKRSPFISETEAVKIKPREQSKLDWDEKLTFEINGAAPQLVSLHIEPAPSHTTLFLCGNSTVVNQDTEPWASWGQMIPRFFSRKVCIANYGESGESATSFIAGNRLKKVLSLVKPGDYIFVEFGHNDEKIKGPDKGPHTSFTEDMRFFVTEARKHGAIPVLLTPTERRSFGEDGRLNPTHGDYPEATRKLAAAEGTALIDLTEMSGILYEALGQEGSKNALVHYPAHTFPGQTTALADNTHFNNYGAYLIAQCVLQGIRSQKLKVAREIRNFKSFDPSRPQAFTNFVWTPSPFFELEKPEGN